MTFQTFTPALQPSIGSGVSWTARLIENNFGDGYRQTAPDGLNAVVGTVNLTWEMLAITDAANIDGFFRNSIGRPFYWQIPNTPSAMLWDCKAWTRTNVSGANDKMTATFTQRFDLG